jgi:hypothetical protein
MNYNNTNKRIIEGYKFICGYTMNITTLSSLESIIGSPLKKKGNFHSVLQSLCEIWNNIADDSKNKICIIMGGMRYRYYAQFMIENFKIKL